MKKYLTRVNLIMASLVGLSLAMLGASVYLVANITVLEGWKLSLPDNEIHVGDTVVVQSTYTKVRDASGESTRYISCKNRNNVWIRYELNRATSDRAKGTAGTGLVLTIRRDIADLPTRCRFEVAITYDVMPLRKVNVYNRTAEFVLLPERTQPATSSSAPASSSTTRSSRSQESSLGLMRSSTQSALAVAEPQSDTSHPSLREIEPSAPVVESSYQTSNRVAIPLVTPLLKLIGLRT